MIDQTGGRDAAVNRVKAERGFELHAAIYLIVNATLATLRAVSGERRFWSIRTMLWWGIGLAFHGWSVYLEKPTSEDEVREIEGGG